MANVYAVIMAGGVGARFWPLSRRANPKQLLPLGPTDESLLAATVRRITDLVPAERVLIVTSQNLADATAAAVPQVPRANILAEPVGRNTAPCIAWAAAHVRRLDPKGILAVLPADHHIGNEAEYVRILKLGAATAELGGLVTVGIKPNRPETGYGYIEVGPETGNGVHRAARFVEKPSLEKAEALLRTGNHVWNSGMFFFSAEAILSEVAKHLPKLHKEVGEIDRAAAEGKEMAAIERLYPAMESISIDYGIMERAETVQVLPADFGWSDLGSWTTAWELAPQDAAGNALPEGAVAVDSSGTYVRTAKGKLVAVVGVHDLIVVDTDDALLIMPRSRAQDVRSVVDALQKRGDKRL